MNTRSPAGATAATILAQAPSAPIADSLVVDAAFKIAFSRFFSSSAGETHTDEKPFNAHDADSATGRAVAERSQRFGPTWGSSLKEAVAYESGLSVKSLGTVTTAPLFYRCNS